MLGFAEVDPGPLHLEDCDTDLVVVDDLGQEIGRAYLCGVGFVLGKKFLESAAIAFSTPRCIVLLQRLDTFIPHVDYVVPDRRDRLRIAE
jgi:hypothetical protein